jgi:hypothetical protein
MKADECSASDWVLVEWEIDSNIEAKAAGVLWKSQESRGIRTIKHCPNQAVFRT